MATFAGDKKVGVSILHRWEKAFVQWMAPRVPKGIETYHLTLMTIPISLGIILCGYFGQANIQWLWGSSFLIMLQWLTDSLDGSVGRYRNTGLIKWGYYMDHLLDYFFLCSILIGYLFVVPTFHVEQFFILAVFAGFMVNSFLSFAATNEFKITHLGLGPTEMRIVFILVNTLLIVIGQTHLAPLLPFVLLASFFGLCFIVYQTQKRLWLIDMEAKKYQK